MLTDSPSSEQTFDSNRRSSLPKVIAGLCAIAVAAALFAGFTLLRQRHLRQVAAGRPAAESAAVIPRQSPKVHILVDEPTLKAGTTFIGGTVKNTSTERLSGLWVALELRLRKDNTSEEKLASLDPESLDPNEEGRYLLKLPAQEYASVRLLGVKSGPDRVAIAYTTAQGQKRPLEKTESKTITVRKSTSSRDEFLNSPDNPVRVP